MNLYIIAIKPYYVTIKPSLNNLNYTVMKNLVGPIWPCLVLVDKTRTNIWPLFKPFRLALLNRQSILWLSRLLDRCLT